MKLTLAALLMVTALGCGNGDTATSTPGVVSSTTASPTSSPDSNRSMESDADALARTTGTPDRALTDTDATGRTLSAEERERLPATASPMPLVALSGLAALFAGLFLRARRTA